LSYRASRGRKRRNRFGYMVHSETSSAAGSTPVRGFAVRGSAVQKSLHLPPRSQSPNRVGSGPDGPPRSSVFSCASDRCCFFSIFPPAARRRDAASARAATSASVFFLSASAMGGDAGRQAPPPPPPLVSAASDDIDRRAAARRRDRHPRLSISHFCVVSVASMILLVSVVLPRHQARMTVDRSLSSPNNSVYRGWLRASSRVRCSAPAHAVKKATTTAPRCAGWWSEGVGGRGRAALAGRHQRPRRSTAPPRLGSPDAVWAELAEMPPEIGEHHIIAGAPCLED